MKGGLRFIPLLVILAFVVAVGWRLTRPEDKEVSSKLVGKPAPALALPSAIPGRPGLTPASLRDGKPHLVNFFASWCVPCIGEVPLLGQLRKEGVDVIGIAVRDKPDDLAAFLRQNGDPYGPIGADLDSGAQLAFGSSGVPESFIVDGKGVIRLQQIGAIDDSDLDRVRAAWKAAQ
ncbi:redoxin family protein [Sphingomonas sp. ASV193]|uniref:redoxin family protein n=1 Tax=Sphingomonas sp. ASV193 TaxID=3144405 RepID=UPI0032E8768B